MTLPTDPEVRPRLRAAVVERRQAGATLARLAYCSGRSITFVYTLLREAELLGIYGPRNTHR